MSGEFSHKGSFMINAPKTVKKVTVLMKRKTRKRVLYNSTLRFGRQTDNYLWQELLSRSMQLPF